MLEKELVQKLVKVRNLEKELTANVKPEIISFEKEVNVMKYLLNLLNKDEFSDLIPPVLRKVFAQDIANCYNQALKYANELNAPSKDVVLKPAIPTRIQK